MAEAVEVPAEPTLTAAEAAKLVAREVPATDKDGKPTGEKKKVPVKADEVLASKVRGDQVTVVTTDGQKLFGTLPAKKA